MESHKEITLELVDNVWKKYLQQLAPPLASPTAREGYFPQTFRSSKETESSRTFATGA